MHEGTDSILQFNNLILCVDAILKERCEDKWLKYIKDQESIRLKFIEVINERKRLLIALECSKKDISTLKSKLGTSRQLLLAEREKRKHQELLKSHLVHKFRLINRVVSENSHLHRELHDELRFLTEASTMSDNEDNGLITVTEEMDSSQSTSVSSGSTLLSEQDLDETVVRAQSYKKHHLDSDEEPVTVKKRRSSVFSSEHVASAEPDSSTQDTPAAFSEFTNREHNFISRSLIKSRQCISCQKKLRFGQSAYTCKDCKATAHHGCCQEVPLPCIQMGTPMKKLVGTIVDYVPQTRPKVPALIVHCVNEIEQRGLKDTGLYRVPGNHVEAHALKEKFLKCKGAPKLEHVDINIICSCLKDFLRELRDPLIPQSERQKFIDSINGDEKCDRLCELISALPEANRHTLAYVILHLQRVASHPESKMPITNLATVFGPTIVGHPAEMVDLTDVQPSNAVMEEMLLIASNFWNEVVTVFPAQDLETTATEVTPVETTGRHSKWTPTPKSEPVSISTSMVTYILLLLVDFVY